MKELEVEPLPLGKDKIQRYRVAWIEPRITIVTEEELIEGLCNGNHFKNKLKVENVIKVTEEDQK